jgi:mRNA interferase MazF
MYKFGAIVLIPFPFSDLSSRKVRPAMIVSKETEDIVVIFITSKLDVASKKVSFFLKDSDKYFEKSGLKVSSVFRFDKIATLDKRLILGELGKVHKDLLLNMKPVFDSVFGF